MARSKWDEVVPKLIGMGVMTNADVDTIARYCTMHEQFVKYLDQCRRGLDVLVIRDDAGKVKYMQSTPAARSGLSASKPQEQDELSAFFAKHG